MTISTKHGSFPGKEMGLLKRAMYFKGFSVKGSGLLNRMLWLNRQEKRKNNNPKTPSTAILTLDSHGLLYKTIQIIKKIQEISVLYTPPLITTELSQNILSNIEKISGGIEFPCNLFSSLKEQLNFSKGALFLLNHYKQEFLPWTYSGFSFNELPKLTIDPQSAVIQIMQNKSYEIMEQARIFHGLDSQKISPLVLIPFNCNNTIIAILSLFKIAINTDGMQTFLDLLADLAKKTADIIYNKRLLQLNLLSKNKRTKNNNVIEAAYSLYDECQENGISLYLLNISLGTILEKVRQRNKYLNVHRFQDDILFFLNSLFTHLGVVFSQKENELFLLLKGYDTFSPEILLHQSYISLQYFFKEISQNWNFDFTYKLKTFPANGASLEELIKEFCPLKTFNRV